LKWPPFFLFFSPPNQVRTTGKPFFSLTRSLVLSHQSKIKATRLCHSASLPFPFFFPLPLPYLLLCATLAPESRPTRREGVFLFSLYSFSSGLKGQKFINSSALSVLLFLFFFFWGSTLWVSIPRIRARSVFTLPTHFPFLFPFLSLLFNYR